MRINRIYLMAGAALFSLLAHGFGTLLVGVGAGFERVQQARRAFPLLVADEPPRSRNPLPLAIFSSSAT